MKRHLSLKRKSLIALCVYLLLFIVISGSLIYWIVMTPISQQLKQNLDLRAEVMAVRIREPLMMSLGTLDSIISIGQSNMDKPNQVNLLEQLFRQMDGIVISGGLWPKPIVLDSDKNYSSLFFNRANDGKVDRIESWNNAQAGGYDQEPWYSAVADAPLNTVYWSAVYVDAYTRVQMFTVSKPYYIDDQFAGVASVDLSLDSLSEFISQSARKYQLGVRLTDAYHSSIASHAFRVKEADYISQYHFPEYSWVLEVVNAKRTVSEEVYDIVANIESWIIPVFILGLVIGYSMLNRHVISPIVDIAERLKNSKEGGMINVPYRSYDEIRYLIDALNQKTVYLEAARMKAQVSTVAKSNFLATVSHEIRTPMNGVLGNAQLLMSDDLTPEQKKRLTALRTSSEHMMRLLDEILDYSKIEQGFLDLDNNDFALEPLLDSIISVYQGLCDEKGLMLELQSNIEEKRCYNGDVSRIKQILFNLLNNAVKFTESGRIFIQFNEERIDSQNAEMTIMVEDSGIGISPEAQEKIFKPFEQAEASTTRRYGGTGLGLAIVDQLVHLMGGEITLFSGLGQGSSFQIKIPLKLSSTIEIMPSFITQEIRFCGLKALIVEDNRVNANILESFLTKRGIECSCAENGELALAKIERAHFDLVLMDHHMPVMDGIETIQRIRTLDSEMSRIFILGCSADVFKQAKDKMLNAGADAMINKPIIEAEFNDLLYRHAAKIYQYQALNAGPAISHDTIENLLVSFNVSIENKDLESSHHLLIAIRDNLSDQLDLNLQQLIDVTLNTIEHHQIPDAKQTDELIMSLSSFC
jgi:signal transduction histidine kinase/CheY-like chemotaxis protein